MSNLKADERAAFALRGLYEQSGYERYKMSRFEEYDLYVRNKDFLVSDQVITFTDRTGKLLALKPDVTLSIIKNTTEEAGVPRKLYYHENVFRVDGDTHSFKEIGQAGLECVGDVSVCDIAQVLSLAVKSLEVLGQDYLLDISHMGLVSAIFSDCGVSQSAGSRMLACLQEKNSHELLALCIEEEITGAAREKLMYLVNCCGKACLVLPGLEPMLRTRAERDAFRELSDLCGILTAMGLDANVSVDFSVGNDLKYYSGVVFKGYLAGLPESVLSGGQYDKLLRKMGKHGKAIGFAVYLDRLERLENTREAYDVDAVLLYDSSDDCAAVLSAAKRLEAQGSVLLSRELPRQKRCRRCYRFQNGEAVCIENHG